MLNPISLIASTREFIHDQFPFGEAFRIFRAVLFASIFIVFAVLAVRNAHAQEALVDRTELVASLGETHGESTVAVRYQRPGLSSSRVTTTRQKRRRANHRNLSRQLARRQQGRSRDARYKQKTLRQNQQLFSRKQNQQQLLRLRGITETRRRQFSRQERTLLDQRTRHDQSRRDIRTRQSFLEKEHDQYLRRERHKLGVRNRVLRQNREFRLARQSQIFRRHGERQSAQIENSKNNRKYIERRYLLDLEQQRARQRRFQSQLRPQRP